MSEAIVVSLSKSIDERCAPMWHTAEFGRTEAMPIRFTCPVCGEACEFDTTRKFIVENQANQEIEFAAGRAKEVLFGKGSETPGIWIPLVCTGEKQHGFTLAFEVEAGKPLQMLCSISEDTYEEMLPEVRQKWASRFPGKKEREETTK